MAEPDSRSEQGISKAERRVSVGYRPKGGDRSTPQVNISGKWLAGMGLEVGMRLRIQVLDGCLVLIPEDRSVARLHEEVARSVQQKRDARQTRQQIETLLAQVSG